MDFLRGVPYQLPPKEPASKKLAGMEELDPDLPQIPFFVGVIGPRHSGKSVLLYNLLSDYPGSYGRCFKKNNIIFYSLTKDKDETMKHLKLTNTYGPPTDVGWLVNEVQSQQHSYSESGTMTGVLLVFDDATQLKSAWGPIKELGFTGRHDHIHLIYVAHKMSSIPRDIRTQTQQWILFKPHEESEREWVLRMFTGVQTWEIFSSAFYRVWNTPFQFIYIDFEEKEMERMYRQGFTLPLFSPEEAALITRTAGMQQFQNNESETDEPQEESIILGKKRRRTRRKKVKLDQG